MSRIAFAALIIWACLWPAAAAGLAAGPTTVRLAMGYDQSQDRLIVNLAASSDSVKNLDLTVEENGLVVAVCASDQRNPACTWDPKGRNWTLTLAPARLRAGHKYELIVRARDGAGQAIVREGTSNDTDPTILTIKEFSFETDPLNFKITAVDVRFDQNKLYVYLALARGDQARVLKYRVLVVDSHSAPVLETSERDFVGLPLEADLSDGTQKFDGQQEYTVTVDLLGQADAAAEQTLDKVKPRVPAAPSLPEQAASALAKSPMIGVAVALVSVITLLWALLSGARPRGPNPLAAPPADETRPRRAVKT